MVHAAGVTVEHCTGYLAKDRLDGQGVADKPATLGDRIEQVPFHPAVENHVQTVILLDHLV